MIRKLEDGSWEITAYKTKEDSDKSVKTKIEVWDSDFNQFAIVIEKDWYWIDKKDFEKCWKKLKAQLEGEQWKKEKE